MSKRYEGYHDTSALPLRPGMIVTIPKGTLVVTRNQPPRPAGKTYKVKINHLMCGSSHVTVTNPRVVWAGTGGYWSEVDLNDVPEAQQPESQP